MTTAYLGTSGIVLNGSVDSGGVQWGWEGSDPWSPSPAPRAVSGDRAADHGAWDATKFYGPRTFALEGRARARTHADLHAAKHRLFAACGVQGFTFRVVEPGFDRQATMRRNGEVLWSELANLRTARFSVPLWARDPLVYSSALQTASTAFPSSSGGLTLPLTVPFSINATSTGSGALSLINSGTEYARPSFRIDGPVVNPTILNDDTGQAMHLDLTLAAGEWVTIDTATGQVLGNGQAGAPRRAQWWGDWFYLAPGVNNLRFIGDSGGPGAQLTASWRSAWI